ncbi:hypothetical protein PICMEDRAFT_105843 [Pichia membranifaciens NRRL Y-2026]|uniref:Uncharacterized protein n=1 Tax=Pichia membranifaciens NRRL Y-2026 TaxID=763406 RepID=A0A1E3NLM9_9ASCO|nr:hypothetical protein PICMEDRAFT_105843 [Pichia membranifaciens NRRL Y-2026]ODQ47052.1 hypothetical protein PICMEDRAFT_105843 [Pichia membranifaciens NRRL Y-2026]
MSCVCICRRFFRHQSTCNQAPLHHGQRILVRTLRHIHAGVRLHAPQHHDAQLRDIQHQRVGQKVPRPGEVPGRRRARRGGRRGRGGRAAPRRRRPLPDRGRGHMQLHVEAKTVVRVRGRVAALAHARRVVGRGVRRRLRRGRRHGGPRRLRRVPHNSVALRLRRRVEPGHHLPLPAPPKRLLQPIPQETAADLRLHPPPHPAPRRHAYVRGRRQLQPLALLQLVWTTPHPPPLFITSLHFYYRTLGCLLLLWVFGSLGLLSGRVLWHQALRFHHYVFHYGFLFFFIFILFFLFLFFPLILLCLSSFLL